MRERDFVKKSPSFDLFLLADGRPPSTPIGWVCLFCVLLCPIGRSFVTFQLYDKYTIRKQTYV